MLAMQPVAGVTSWNATRCRLLTSYIAGDVNIVPGERFEGSETPQDSKYGTSWETGELSLRT